MRLVALAACLVAATPAYAQTGTKPAAEEKAPAEGKKPAEAFDMAKLMGMFDKIFPAGPEPAPERLALAKVTAEGVLPNGTYAALFDDAMSGIVDRVLTLKPSDFAMKGELSKGATATSLRDEIAKEDPHFEERMKIMRRVIGEELIKISAVMEPKLREGLARSIARRLDERQLRDVNAFLATDSGKAFAGQTMRMWVDPDVMRSMVQSLPHMFAAMPGAMMRLEAETKHLPKPKKKSDEKKADAKADSQS
ncbi:MAG TPA: hypothetical protein VFZ35_01700 [Sphingomicrobium sp.]